VDAVTIDDEALEDVGFIKVDVEQHERQVLRGGLATIRRCRPVLLVELYPLRYARSLPEEVGFLTSAGYCPWFKFAGRWFPMSDFRQDEHARRENWGHEGRFVGNNVIFLPAEHELAKVGPLGKR
jgi:hypothetical protein